MKTIGIVGGMGSYATSYFFKRILDSFPAQKEWDRPRIIIDNNCVMPSRVRAILYGEKKSELISQMSDSINYLYHAGASEIVLCCITAHCFFESLPNKENIINLVDITAKQIAKIGVRELFVLCTEGTLDVGIWSDYLYPLGIAVKYPDDIQMTCVREYIEIVKQNKLTQSYTEGFKDFINKLPSENILLGCTELPVLYNADISKRIFDPLQCCINYLSENVK